MSEKKFTDKGLVDSNILIYTIDTQDAAKHKKANKFLEQIIDSPHMFVISLQNLREFASIVIKKKQVSEESLNEQIDLLKNSFSLILKDNEGDVQTASKTALEKKAPFWDALIAATMQRHGINLIYTENTKDFKKIEGIKTINPVE